MEYLLTTLSWKQHRDKWWYGALAADKDYRRKVKKSTYRLGYGWASLYSQPMGGDCDTGSATLEMRRLRGDLIKP